MKAVVIDNFVKSLKDLKVQDLPRSKSDDTLLVRCTHAAATHVDLLYAKGLHQNNRRHVTPPFTLGTEFAGVVISAPSTTRFPVGTRVYGVGLGSYAEYISVLESYVREVPKEWSNAEACAVGASGAIAWASLVQVAKIKRGQYVLVLGASGGLGSMAVQVATSLGAKVIAVVGTEEKGKIVRSLGAAHVVNYRDPSWEDRVKSFTSDAEGVDIVYDTVGQVQSSIKCLRYGGTVLVIGFAGRGGKMEELKVNRILLKGVSVIGYRFGEDGRQKPHETEATWTQFGELASQGMIKPVIYEKEYRGLEAVPEALQDMEDHKPFGRAIITIADEKVALAAAKL